MREVRGNYQGKGKKICVVVSRFNEFVSDKLLEGCIDELKKQGVASADITVFWVPGSFEIPQLLAKLCATKKYNAFIALGVLVRGDTPHFDFLNKFEFLYSSSANRHRDSFDYSFAYKRADIIIEDKSGLSPKSASSLYKLNKKKIQKLR